MENTKKGKLKSEKIWKIQMLSVSQIVKRYGKHGGKLSWIVKRYGKCERKVGWIVKKYWKIWTKNRLNCEMTGKYGRK